MLEDDELLLCDMDKETLKRRHVEIYLFNDPWAIDVSKLEVKSSTMDSKNSMVELFADNHRSYTIQKHQFTKTDGHPMAWFYLKFKDPMKINGFGLQMPEKFSGKEPTGLKFFGRTPNQETTLFNKIGLTKHDISSAKKYQEQAYKFLDSSIFRPADTWDKEKKHNHISISDDFKTCSSTVGWRCRFGLGVYVYKKG